MCFLSLLFACAFRASPSSDLCIKAIELDDLMAEPDNPDKDLVVLFDTKSLRDTRQLLVSWAGWLCFPWVGGLRVFRSFHELNRRMTTTA